jgi:hypothetical protein
MMNWNRVEGSDRGLNEDTIPEFSEGSTENHTKTQDSRSPGRDLNPRPPENEAGVLIGLRESRDRQVDVPAEIKIKFNVKGYRIDFLQQSSNGMYHLL